MKTQSWLWHDRAISKRESRQLRVEHNRLVNLNAELLEACHGFLKAVQGESYNSNKIEQACDKARVAIAHAEQP